jgi:hypothetical protein
MVHSHLHTFSSRALRWYSITAVPKPAFSGFFPFKVPTSIPLCQRASCTVVRRHRTYSWWAFLDRCSSSVGLSAMNQILTRQARHAETERVEIFAYWPWGDIAAIELHRYRGTDGVFEIERKDNAAINIFRWARDVSSSGKAPTNSRRIDLLATRSLGHSLVIHPSGLDLS